MTSGSICCTGPTSGNQDESAECQQRSSGTPRRTCCEQAQHQSCQSRFDRDRSALFGMQREDAYASPETSCLTPACSALPAKACTPRGPAVCKEAICNMPCVELTTKWSKIYTSAAGMSGSHPDWMIQLSVFASLAIVHFSHVYPHE